MPRRQRATWGSITRLDRNRYRIRWWEQRADGYNRRSETFRGTRREAERRLAEIRSGLDEAAPHGRAMRKAAGMTVRDAFERWNLPEMEQRLADGLLAKKTYRNKMTRWKLSVAPRFGDVLLSDVRALDVQDWLSDMTQKPASDSLALLRQIIDKAVLYEVVADNVARRPYVMPRGHEDMKDGAYTLRELDAIAQAAEGMPCEAAILLMCFAGCRVGESLGVMLDEVRLVESHGLTLTTCEVVRQVTSDCSISADGTLKNRQSVRTVVVPPPWAARVWDVAECRRALGHIWLNDSGALTPHGQNRLRAEWRDAVARAGVEPKQMRAARRSWETYMRWDMGVEQSRIEQMMGHALPGVTGEHYDKPTAAAFCETVAEAFERKPFVRA